MPSHIAEFHLQDHSPLNATKKPASMRYVPTKISTGCVKIDRIAPSLSKYRDNLRNDFLIAMHAFHGIDSIFAILFHSRSKFLTN